MPEALNKAAEVRFGSFFIARFFTRQVSIWQSH
jgi:hypothetical protein